jgi:ribA/ribD-fused uncharacterized protein
MKSGEEIVPFFKKIYVFSNHYQCQFIVDNVQYTTSEQYYAVQKARFHGCHDVAENIMKMTHPGAMKSAANGRNLPGFNSEKWRQVAGKIMAIGCYQKFSQNYKLREILLDTGHRELVEASPFDRVWGIGIAMDNPHIRDRRLWRGDNLLGTILSKLREKLRTESASKQARRGQIKAVMSKSED